MLTLWARLPLLAALPQRPPEGSPGPAGQAPAGADSQPPAGAGAAPARPPLPGGPTHLFRRAPPTLRLAPRGPSRGPACPRWRASSLEAPAGLSPRAACRHLPPPQSGCHQKVTMGCPPKHAGKERTWPRERRPEPDADSRCPLRLTGATGNARQTHAAGSDGTPGGRSPVGAARRSAGVTPSLTPVPGAVPGRVAPEDTGPARRPAPRSPVPGRRSPGLEEPSESAPTATAHPPPAGRGL